MSLDTMAATAGGSSAGSPSRWKWNLGGGRKGNITDPLGIFTATKDPAAQRLQELGLGNAEAATAALNQLDFSGYADTIWQKALGLDTGEAGEQNLWKLQSNRLLEALRPALAARGLATSGPGINVEGQKLGELNTEFTARAFERNVQRQQLMQEAAKGIAVLKSLPIELRNQLIAAITGAQTAGTTPSILQQYGGGGGLSAMMSSKGGGGGK